jgi:hypothetical protein
MKTNVSHNLFWAICLIGGQSLECASTFFWNDEGRHTPLGATMVILGMVLWIAGFVRIFEWFRNTNPWFFRIGLLYAIYGCVGGIAFGFEGLFSAIYGLEKIGVEAHQEHPLLMNLVMFWAGPAFPLSIVLVGALIWHKRLFAVYVPLLMIIGGLAFPISRITRLTLVAHAADLILLIPIVIISLHLINEKAVSKSGL